MATTSPMLACAAGLAVAVAGSASPAPAQSVFPVVLDLAPAGRNMSQMVTVQNPTARAMPVEIRVEGIDFTAAGPRGIGRDPGDLVVFPAQAMIGPGQSQAFRIQFAGDPGLADSRHYYITVAQLPVRQAVQTRSIQLLYNFQVMVSVAPRGGKPDLKVVSARMQRDARGGLAPVIEIANGSSSYGYLSQGSLKVVERDAAGAEVSRRTLTGSEILQTIGYGLIGGHQTRQLTLPASATRQGTSVDVQFVPQNRR